MPVLGLVVAGPYDEVILVSLARRIRPEVSEIHCRVCFDDSRVTRLFKQYLEDFRYVNAGGPVDKAIVVRDTHRKRPEQVLEKLTANYDPAEYPFPVKFVAVVPEPEAWLLADHEALSTISTERGRSVVFPATSTSPEQHADPKCQLRVTLGRAHVPYTRPAAQRLAELAQVDLIERWCPAFTGFKTSVIEC